MIYVASSWRNQRQPGFIQDLHAGGMEAYDFRNPAPDNHGFSWAEIDPKWQSWTPEEFRAALQHPIAKAGFNLDMRALCMASTCILVMPCGKSAHLELGFAVGEGKYTAVYLEEKGGEPELMYSMVDLVTTDRLELLNWAIESEHEAARVSAPASRPSPEDEVEMVQM
jgi:hypothetical protein